MRLGAFLFGLLVIIICACVVFSVDSGASDSSDSSDDQQDGIAAPGDHSENQGLQARQFSRREEAEGHSSKNGQNRRGARSTEHAGPLHPNPSDGAGGDAQVIADGPANAQNENMLFLLSPGSIGNRIGAVFRRVPLSTIIYSICSAAKTFTMNTFGSFIVPVIVSFSAPLILSYTSYGKSFAFVFCILSSLLYYSEQERSKAQHPRGRVFFAPLLYDFGMKSEGMVLWLMVLEHFVSFGVYYYFQTNAWAPGGSAWRAMYAINSSYSRPSLVALTLGWDPSAYYGNLFIISYLSFKYTEQLANIDRRQEQPEGANAGQLALVGEQPHPVNGHSTQYTIWRLARQWLLAIGNFSARSILFSLSFLFGISILFSDFLYFINYVLRSFKHGNLLLVGPMAIILALGTFCGRRYLE